MIISRSRFFPFPYTLFPFPFFHSRFSVDKVRLQFCLHCRDGPSRGWHRKMRVLLREREQGGSYTGPLFKLPSDRAVTYAIFAYPKNSEMVGSGLEPASPGSEARTQHTEPSNHPKTHLKHPNQPLGHP